MSEQPRSHAGRPPVFTIRQARESVELYCSGLTCRNVVEALGAKYGTAPSQQWVYDQLKAAGVKTRRRVASPMRGEAIELYCSGLPCRKVAEVLGAKFGTAPSHQWVLDQVRAAGIEPRRRHARVARSARATVLELRKRGFLYREISERTGLSVSTVHRIVKGVAR